MRLYVNGDSKGKRTRLGEKFYEEFKTSFWQKPSKYHMINILYIIFNFINSSDYLLLGTNYDLLHEINKESSEISRTTSPSRSPLYSPPSSPPSPPPPSSSQPPYYVVVIED